MMNELGKKEEYIWEMLTNFKRTYNKILPYIFDVKYNMFNETDKIELGGNRLFQFPNGISHVKIEVTTGEKEREDNDESLSILIEYINDLQRKMITGEIKIYNISILQTMGHGDNPDLFMDIDIQRPVQSFTQQCIDVINEREYYEDGQTN